ncbi:hypothetical protein DITRI_Ditri03aG0140400 [Diplodiscus trichospermus]
MENKLWLAILLTLALVLGHVSSPANARSLLKPTESSAITSHLRAHQHVNFGMLPKGVPIPPSGPSRRTSDSPPPPRFM